MLVFHIPPPDALLIVVLLEISFERFRQAQLADSVVLDVADDGRPAELLQREGKLPAQWVGEHRLEEHYARGVLVVLEQAGYGWGRVHAGITRVETKHIVELLDPGVQRSAVLAERHRKQKLLLGGIAQQERALRFALEQLLRLVPVHLAPVEAAVGDLLQVWDQVVPEVDLRVHLWSSVLGV